MSTTTSHDTEEVTAIVHELVLEDVVVVVANEVDGGATVDAARRLLGMIHGDDAWDARHGCPDRAPPATGLGLA
jgi:hypothetical protein